MAAASDVISDGLVSDFSDVLDLAVLLLPPVLPPFLYYYLANMEVSGLLEEGVGALECIFVPDSAANGGGSVQSRYSLATSDVFCQLDVGLQNVHGHVTVSMAILSFHEDKRGDTILRAYMSRTDNILSQKTTRLASFNAASSLDDRIVVASDSMCPFRMGTLATQKSIWSM